MIPSNITPFLILSVLVFGFTIVFFSSCPPILGFILAVLIGTTAYYTREDEKEKREQEEERLWRQIKGLK